MTHYFQSKEGNKVIGIENGVVTEYDILFTKGECITLVPELVEEETIGNIIRPRVKGLSDIKVKVTRKPPTNLSELSEEERKARKKEYMKEYNKNYHKKNKVKVEKVVKDPSDRAQVLPEPNLKLIQEFGKHVVDNIILCKRQGYTAEEFDDDKPAHCGHLVFGQIERILNEVKA